MCGDDSTRIAPHLKEQLTIPHVRGDDSTMDTYPVAVPHMREDGSDTCGKYNFDSYSLHVRGWLYVFQQNAVFSYLFSIYVGVILPYAKS